MRTNLDPDDLGDRRFYRFLTAVVVPRPIAWVSTTSPDGVDNLAPHSFFNVACARPPIVQFSSVGRKDTLRNVEASGEFVVNLAPEPLRREVNATATDFPPEIGEFDAVGLERAASAVVAPPRVAGSPVALECRLHSTLRLGDSTVVFGRVVHASIDSDMFVDGHPEITRLRPLSRLGGDEWGTVGEVDELHRIRYADWDGAFGAGRTSR
ncbi:flavin reductase family protein [Marinactinospora thermotolerans]|uniref:NADH-FMN oxidoreductase RutF, flavin reductase (DIM6/NTAB) family n=1 Tax=Marinactinospora thermotolerans DSM 45154 TaxID=1122192 RepID=A0A1T4NRY1_9ACTN|nr:flavin reductase family protein [Marinactinospora thermotolerans]SJZ82051.1 NADH-FMN oxidoreductase RutF, flavin reductase (DIM6/NTAB) family [Marinactinospora thermotolerans DSM 45154]